MRAALDSGESSEHERESESKRQKTERFIEVTEFNAIIQEDNTTGRESTCCVRNFTTAEALDTAKKYENWIAYRRAGAGDATENTYSESSWEEVSFRVQIGSMLKTHHASKARIHIGINQSPTDITLGPDTPFQVRDYRHDEAEENITRMYEWLKYRSSPQLFISPQLEPTTTEEYLHRLALTRVLSVVNTTSTIPLLRTLVAETPERNRRPVGESPQRAQQAEDREVTTEESESLLDTSDEDEPVGGKKPVEGSPLKGEKRKRKKKRSEPHRQ